jgi:hypothetical protein
MGKQSPKGKLEKKLATKASIHVDGSPTRCPYCHEDCAADEEALVCESCLSRHHVACWSDHGSCSSCSSDRAMQQTGEQSQDTEQQVSASPCACCGQKGVHSMECPGCHKDSCDSCYLKRFRRCIDCSADYLSLEVEGKHAAAKAVNYQGPAFLMIIATLVSIVGIAFGIDDRSQALLGGSILGVSFFAVMSIISVVLAIQAGNKGRQIEMKLAPFQKTKKRGGR